MKKLTLIVFILKTSLFAQTITYSFSQEFEIVKKHRNIGSYEFGPDSYVEAYMQKDEKDILFQVFDKNFNGLKKTETVKIPEFEKTPTDQSFVKVKDNFYWLFSTKDKKAGTESLFALPVNKELFKFEKEIKLFEAKRFEYSFKYAYSEDRSKMLITYRLGSMNNTDKDIIGFNLFDQTMKKLYAAEIEMPYSRDEMNNLDYTVDSRGNIYILALVNINNSLDGVVTDKDKKAYRYELVRVNQKNNTLQKIDIRLDNKYTNSVILTETPNHNIIITGYYSSEENIGLQGVYIIHVEYDGNDNIKNVSTTYCKLPDEIMKVYEKGSSMKLNNIIFNPDGSTMIVGQEYSMTKFYRNYGGSYVEDYSCNYNDILILKTDKDWKTIWCNRIPKRQSGGGLRDLSYHHHVHNGSDYFFYLDDERNANLSFSDIPELYMSGTGGYLTYVKIDESGKMTKHFVFDTRNEHLKIFPSSLTSISPNLMVDHLKTDQTEKIFKLEIK